MAISTDRFCGHVLLERVFDREKQVMIRLKKPLPHWAPYSEDAEFRFLYETYSQGILYPANRSGRAPPRERPLFMGTVSSGSNSYVKNVAHCFGRWCDRSFSNYEELLKHTTPSISNPDEFSWPTGGNKFTQCVSCGSELYCWWLFETACKIQITSSEIKAKKRCTKVSWCALEIARTACKNGKCSRNKAQWYLQLQQQYAEAEV